MPNNKKIMANNIEGLALISRSIDNLKWWINNKAPQNIPSNDYKLLLDIKNNFGTGLKNIHSFKRLSLAIALDKGLTDIIKQDKELQGVCFTIIHNQHKDEKVDLGKVFYLDPINISVDG